MKSLDPKNSIVPILRASKDDPVTEVLGTGFVVGNNTCKYIVTAKHVFEGIELAENEKFAFACNDGKDIGIWGVKRKSVSRDYDIAYCDIDLIEGLVPLHFSKEMPSLNADVFCYEYSRTNIERKPQGGKHVSFQPLMHKGNIMRYFDSNFPESKVTPSFTTSFPALQGASGAPVIAVSKNKNFYIAGMMVANQEIHLLPAQIIKIEDGESYKEETSYFLPLGKAINASLLATQLEGLGLKIEFVD